jgi:hypothetical protein
VEHFQGLELRRVVLVPPQEDERVRVQSVELFEDAVSLRWVLPSGLEWPETAAEGMFGLRNGSFALRDDVGTEYRLAGSIAGKFPVVAHGTSFFTPAVPEHASRLTIVMATSVIEVVL